MRKQATPSSSAASSPQKRQSETSSLADTNGADAMDMDMAVKRTRMTRSASSATTGSSSSVAATAATNSRKSGAKKTPTLSTVSESLSRSRSGPMTSRAKTGSSSAASGSAMSVDAAAALSAGRLQSGSDFGQVDPRVDMRSNESGQVFVVGSGDCGQLGLGPDIFEKEKLSLLSFFDDKDIVAIFAGGLHNLALSRQGKLYSWGCNDQKALGRDGEETEPALVQVEEDVVFVNAVCGDSISAGLTDRGDVYIWGTFRNSNGIFGARPNAKVADKPMHVKELRQINSLAAGTNHVIAVARDGKVYTFGVGEQGQLGRRVAARFAERGALTATAMNAQVGAGTSKRYRNAFCNAYSTYMVNLRGPVYSFGLNNYGQLGLGDVEEHMFPRKAMQLDLPVVDGKQAEVKQIAGGEHHTLILDSFGNVYGCGRGDSGQLGLADKPEAQMVPARIPGVTKAKMISAGAAFSMCVDESGDVYAWGYGEMGQLANGGVDADAAQQVEMKGRVALMVAAGGQHSVFLLRRK